MTKIKSESKCDECCSKKILLKILQHNFGTLWHNIPFIFLYFTFWLNLHPTKDTGETLFEVVTSILSIYYREREREMEGGGRGVRVYQVWFV
jgi:hypothetical protein